MSRFLFVFLLMFVLNNTVLLSSGFAQFQFINHEYHHDKHAKKSGCKKVSKECRCDKGNKHKMH